MSHLTRLHLKLLIWADLGLVREAGNEKGEKWGQNYNTLVQRLRNTSRVRSFSTILPLKYLMKWKEVYVSTDFTDSHGPVFCPLTMLQFWRSMPSDPHWSFRLWRSFVFRTRPGFHKILDAFFPHWTKQVWQSTLFDKQMITSFFQIEKAINWGLMEYKYFAAILEPLRKMRWERCFIFPENWIERKTADHAARIMWDIKIILLSKGFCFSLLAMNSYY